MPGLFRNNSVSILSGGAALRPASHQGTIRAEFGHRRKRLPLIVLVKEPPAGILLEHVNVLRGRSLDLYQDIQQKQRRPRTTGGQRSASMVAADVGGSSMDFREV